MDMDCRCWRILPNRSDNDFAVSPTTCPLKILPTVFWITFASLVAVVTCKLREVLEAETDGHLVASGGRNQVVDTTEIDGRKLVDDDGTFQLSFLVHQFDDARIVQAESRRIDILPVRIIAHAEDFWGVRDCSNPA